MNVIFIMMREMKCLLSGNNIRNKKLFQAAGSGNIWRKDEKMDGFEFINDEKNREKKKVMRVCSVLAWTALILMWAVLAARSIGAMG